MKISLELKERDFIGMRTRELFPQVKGLFSVPVFKKSVNYL